MNSSVMNLMSSEILGVRSVNIRKKSFRSGMRHIAFEYNITHLESSKFPVVDRFTDRKLENAMKMKMN